MPTFFRISNRCHDGLLFMGRLALEWGKGAVTIETAACHGASAGYLEQIVTPLRQAGLVSGKRGPGGGYSLTRDPQKITVREVVEALEGRLALVACQVGQCCGENHCGSAAIWNKLRDRIGETLDSLTLADVAGE